MSNATLPERKRKKERTGQSRISSTPVPAGVSWTPEISEEEKQRNYFRWAMGNAFFTRPTNANEAIVRADKVLRAIYAWKNTNAEKILGCWIVIRADQVEVLVYEQLREFDAEFSERLSEFGVELAQLGISALVTPIPIDTEAGEKIGDKDYVLGDPYARIGV